MRIKGNTTTLQLLTSEICLVRIVTVGDEKFKRLQPYRGSKQPRVYQSSIADIPNTGMVARNTGLGKSDSGSRG